jgi:hypothetical protein
MLLGDAEDHPSPSVDKSGKPETTETKGFGKGLDVLHEKSSSSRISRTQ